MMPSFSWLFFGTGPKTQSRKPTSVDGGTLHVDMLRMGREDVGTRI